MEGDIPAHLNSVTNDGETAEVKPHVGKEHAYIDIEVVDELRLKLSREENGQTEHNLDGEQEHSFKVIRYLIFGKQLVLLLVHL
jgi:hypothetical protein